MATLGPLEGWYVGDQKTLVWEIRDANRKIVPVTGWTGTVRIYRRRHTEPVHTLNVQVVNEPAGLLSCRVPAAVTINLGAGSYRYVLTRTNLNFEQVLDDIEIPLRLPGS